MTKNMCGIDRVLRTGLGLIMIYLGTINTQFVTDTFAGGAPFARGALILIGCTFIIVAIFANCPLYKLIDFSSISEKNTDS